MAQSWTGIDRAGPGFNNATRHLRDLIEGEVCYPTNVLAVLRQLPPETLATLEDAFEQMRCERAALAARRKDRGL
jgi:hypothetical protein